MNPQNNDKRRQLYCANKDKQPEGYQVTSADALPKHPAMMIIVSNAPIAIGTMVAAPKPIQRTGHTVCSLLFVGVLFVFEDGPCVQKTDQKVEHYLRDKGEFDTALY